MDNNILHYLAKNNASYKPFRTTTTAIAKDLNSSQQTVSRKLILLEKEGWIIRDATLNGLTIKLTDRAINKLKEDYTLLKSTFDTTKELTGTLTTGLGEGRYYMQQQEYQIQFREKLGFFPWHGTLNVKVEIDKLRRFLITQKPEYIEGFKSKERTFGGLWAYPTTVYGEKAAIIVPVRTAHPEDIVEIISPTETRKKHELKDGDLVVISK